MGAFVSVILQVEEPTSVFGDGGVAPGRGCAVSLSLLERAHPEQGRSCHSSGGTQKQQA